jgi:hypothetical protein
MFLRPVSIVAVVLASIKKISEKLEHKLDQQIFPGWLDE